MRLEREMRQERLERPERLEDASLMSYPAPVIAGPMTRPVSTPSLNRLPVAVAATIIVAGAAYLGATVSWRQSTLFLVGAAAGVVLYHAAFGFTSAWRAFVVERRGAPMRAQMLMLAVTCAVFMPAIAGGQVLGQTVRGSVSPVGVSVVVGAFLFGIGMQLGGSCASGTLYTTGGGNTRMLATLISFIAGSVLGVIHMPLWERTPSLKPMSLIVIFGPLTALVISLTLFGVIAAGTTLMERRGQVSRTRQTDIQREPWRRVLHGPWPLAAGALGLAAVNIATLVLAGRPWGVTSAFALWGSKILAATGIDVRSWSYWAAPARTAELNASVLKDITSVMDFGIMLGALAAAGLAGRFAPVWRVGAKPLAASLVGGLLLGYGARIAYGCNIGAYFSGIASASVHGWLWLASAFAGSAVGIRLRPWFALSVGRSS
jgi:uncharacterized membrane protein YedE/YeeE